MEAFCKAEEFGEIRFHQDKGLLNELNKQPGIRYKIKGRISTVDQKVNMLIQCSIGNVTLPDQKKTHSMVNDTTFIMQQANRISKGVVEIFLAKGSYEPLLKSIYLTRSISTKLWENTKTMIRQLDGIGPQLAQALITANLKNVQDILQADPRQLELILGRNPPFGNKLQESASRFPKFKLEVLQLKAFNSTSKGDLDLNILLGVENPEHLRMSGKWGSLMCYFIVGTSKGRLLDYRKISMQKIRDGNTFSLQLRCTSKNERIICNLISQEYVGIDLSFSFLPDNSGNKLQASYCDDDEFEDLEIDDLCFREIDSIVSAKVDRLVVPSTQVSTILGDLCNHQCKDKSSCRHQCCKSGVSKKRKPKLAVVPTMVNVDDSTKPKRYKIASLKSSIKKDDNLSLNNRVEAVEVIARPNLSSFLCPITETAPILPITNRKIFRPAIVEDFIPLKSALAHNQTVAMNGITQELTPLKVTLADNDQNIFTESKAQDLTHTRATTLTLKKPITPSYLKPSPKSAENSLDIKKLFQDLF
jgi:hypothetical protein